jgi:hypothetical protein
LIFDYGKWENQMPRAAKRSFYAYLSEVAWRTIAYAYGRAPNRVSFSEIWRKTDSPVFNSNVFADLVHNNLITGTPEAFTITETGKALYEGGYIYYRHFHPSVPLTKPPFFKRIAAANLYGIYRLGLYVTTIRKTLLNWNQRIQRRTKYKEAQTALAQIAAWPSNFDDGLRLAATVIQEYLGINVVAIFIADPAAEWSTFRTGVAKEPHGEEGIRILKERGHKTYLRDKIWLIDYREGSSYQSDSAPSCSHHLLSIPRLYLETRHFFGSPLFSYTGSAIYIPLFASQRQIGTLELDTFNTQASFRQDELSTLLPLADQVAQICERYLNADQPDSQL